MTLCPLCKCNSDLIYHTKDYNRKISNEIFYYYNCNNCNYIFLKNIPSDLNSYYKDDYYKIPKSIEQLKKISNKQQYQINLINKFKSSGKLLEIGPAFGVFAYLAKMNGFDVETIEMDLACSNFLNNILKINTYNTNDPISLFKTLETYDIMVLWHVIEHVPDPFNLIKIASTKLNNNGIILIACPNPNSLSLAILKSFWPHIDAPRHLQLIPLQLLIKNVKSFNLTPVLITENDKGGRSWNIFTWQKLLMNTTKKIYLQYFYYILGYLFGFIFSLLEIFTKRGSAYTVIFKKNNNI